jgi:hypothetical protein
MSNAGTFDVIGKVSIKFLLRVCFELRLQYNRLSCMKYNKISTFFYNFEIGRQTEEMRETVDVPSSSFPSNKIILIKHYNLCET